MKLAIVVPCYNEQEVLEETSSRLLNLLRELSSEGLVNKESKICLVDDCSTDQTGLFFPPAALCVGSAHTIPITVVSKFYKKSSKEGSVSE